MPRVNITGWRNGLQKLAMTKSIRILSRLNLAEAKHCTDLVLAGKSVIVAVSTMPDAQQLVEELRSFGAIAEVAE